MLCFTKVCFAFQDKRMTHYDVMVYDITPTVRFKKHDENKMN